VKLTVVVPVYNEQRTLDEIIRRVQAVDLEKEIICVDDASKDDSWAILERLARTHANIRIFKHDVNQGKGAAIRTGLAKMEGDIAVIQDADLEYDPKEYFTLIGPIMDGRADVVFGSRFLGGPHRVHLFFHYMANKFLTFVSNVFTNLNLTDMETCYKVMRREVVQRLNLKTNRFGVNRRSPRRSLACVRGSTKFRFPTAVATSARARRSVGRTGSRPCGRF